MILRRVIEHVREQNWTAIGIDFCIVVIGVFVGIQVSNWNETRLSRDKSAVFTERLKDDLRKEGWRYQFLLAYYRDVRDATETTADALSGKAPLSNEAFLVNAYRATQYKQGAGRRATYDELISTGGIGLIEDRELLQLAVRAYSLTTLENLAKEGIESHYRQLFRMTIPNETQRALARQCGDRYILPGDFRGFDQVIDYPCETGLPEADINAAVDALRSAPQTLPYLRLRVADIETRLQDLTGNNRDVFEGFLEIAKEQP
ncbi:MAG: DUF6090 family protein [Dokdonella sp.]|uniref:DUF6090 family protein n=1 Tax=Dokdonella sp. TaxID=2291710 RepID=UPI003BB1B871